MNRLFIFNFIERQVWLWIIKITFTIVVTDKMILLLMLLNFRK